MTHFSIIPPFAATTASILALNLVQDLRTMAAGILAQAASLDVFRLSTELW